MPVKWKVSQAHAKDIHPNFILIGKSYQNGQIKTFDNKLHEELLNTQIYFSLHEAREKLEQLRFTTNTIQPLRKLGYRPPAEYAQHTVGSKPTNQSFSKIRALSSV